MNKNLLLHALALRNKRFRQTATYVAEEGLHPPSEPGFTRLSHEGEDIYDCIDAGHVDFTVKARLDIYLDGTENILSGIGFYHPEEYCDILDVLEYFQYNRQLIEMYWNGFSDN